MKSQRWKMHVPVAVLTVAAMALALTPAVADPLSGPDEYPNVAFLARNDVPFDAQTAASMAAQLGAPMFITNPRALSEAAAEGIGALNPDVLIVAGGEFAISQTVATEAAEQCDPDCDIDRRFGSGRDETAAALAGLAADYGLNRPVLQGSGQVVGDVNVGGTVNADAITVQDTGLVSGFNADRVDGKHASAFLGATETAADSDRLDGRDDHFHPDNDGSGSGLDADTVDGVDSTALGPPTVLEDSVRSAVLFPCAGSDPGACPEIISVSVSGAGTSWLIRANGVIVNTGDSATSNSNRCALVSGGGNVRAEARHALGADGAVGHMDSFSLTMRTVTVVSGEPTFSLRCTAQDGESLQVEDAALTAIEVDRP